MCDNTEAAARRREYIANRDYLTGGEFVIEAFGKTIRLIPEEGAGELCGKLWSVALVLINQLEKDYGIDGLKGKRVLELGAGLGAVGLALACAGAHVTCTDIPDCIEMLNRCDFVFVHLHAYSGDRSHFEWCLQLITGENVNMKTNALYGLCWVIFARMRQKGALLILPTGCSSTCRNIEQNRPVFEEVEGKARSAELWWGAEGFETSPLAQENEPYDLIIGSDLIYDHDVHEYLLWSINKVRACIAWTRRSLDGACVLPW
jgi:predicted nicotinamide N-methyase